MMSGNLDTSTEEDGQTARIDEATVEAANAASAPRNVHVESLSTGIGPRPAGSDGEQQAADYLVQALGNAGAPAARLRAQAPASAFLPEIIVAAGGFVSILVALIYPAAGLVLLVVVTLLALADKLGYIRIGGYLPERETVNVLSIVPPAESEVRRLIVTTSLDTGPASLLAKRHFAFLYGWLHTAILGSLGIALLVTIILLVDGGNALRLVLLLPALVLLAVLGLLVEREISKAASPGAISNASGVAALVNIARTTTENPPRWLEVWFLGVGASRMQGGGLVDFLSKNTFDPDTTYFVHLQSPGGGLLHVPKSTGMGFNASPATPLLTWIFDSVRNATDGNSDIELQRLPIESLAQVTHRAGYQSVVLAGVDEQHRIPYLDHDQDLPYQVTEESINEAATLVALAIDALDREVAARAMLARSTASIQQETEGPPQPEGLPTSGE